MLVVTAHGKPRTSDGPNFFVRTLFRMFLDSVEINLSLESIYIYSLIILELILGPEIKKTVGPAGSSCSHCLWEASNFRCS